MKLAKKIFIIILLLIIYSYVFVITQIPENIVLLEGEKINLKPIVGVNLNLEDKQAISASSDIGQKVSNKTNTAKLTVNLFNSIPIKEAKVDIIPKTKVIPVGDIAGVKLYASGVLVVGMSEVKGKKPYENTDIQEGDMIIKIDDTNITCTNDLIKNVNQSKGNKIEVEYVREGETKQCSMTPVKYDNDEYKLGLWVRDSAAGVGTVTFYETSTRVFWSFRTWNYRY